MGFLPAAAMAAEEPVPQLADGLILVHPVTEQLKSSSCFNRIYPCCQSREDAIPLDEDWIQYALPEQLNFIAFDCWVEIEIVQIDFIFKSPSIESSLSFIVKISKLVTFGISIESNIQTSEDWIVVHDSCEIDPAVGTWSHGIVV